MFNIFYLDLVGSCRGDIYVLVHLTIITYITIHDKHKWIRNKTTRE